MILDKLWRAQWERKKLQKKFDPLISAAERENKKEHAEMLIHEFLDARELINNRISSVETTRVQEKAEKYGIPIPALSDKDSWNEGYGAKGIIVFLSAKARLELLSDIRKERRARWEDRTIWIDRLVLPLIGLLGAATALVSVWKH